MASGDNIAQIQDMDEFRRRDTLFRTDPAARADAINQLATLGGDTVMDIARRIRSRLLSDDIMAQLNGMQNFSETEIYSVLREAIIMACGAPEGEVERVMKDHFPDAPDGGREAIIMACGAPEGEVERVMKDHFPDAPDGGRDNIAQIEDMDAFRRREELFRIDPAARADAINQLANCEDTLKHITRRIMNRLLSNGVMAQFSLKGKRGKMNFSITEIYSVLKEAIIRASGASVNEVEIAMREHLRDAPDRVAGAGRDAFRVDDLKDALPEGAAPVDNIAKIEDMDEFKRREELFTTNHAARADAINQLALVGGATVRDTTYNTMDRLLSNGVMAQFSLKGKCGKMNFSITEIYSVLKDAIIQVTRASESEVVNAMETCLIQAPDRVGGGGRQNVPN